MKKILSLMALVSSVACGDTYNTYATGEGSGNAGSNSGYTVEDACEAFIQCNDKYKHDYGKDMGSCVTRLQQYAALPEVDEGCLYRCFATQCQDNMEDHCYLECS